MEKQFYFMKLIANRATFPLDMTEDERMTMGEHRAYWDGLMEKGICYVFGPVMDPKGIYGMGVVSVPDEGSVKEIQENDPFVKADIGYYEAYPMQAIVPGGN